MGWFGSKKQAEQEAWQAERQRELIQRRSKAMSVMAAAAASIKTLLSPALQEKFDQQAPYQAHAGLIACVQQVLENQGVILANQRAALKNDSAILAALALLTAPPQAVTLSIEEDFDMRLTLGADDAGKKLILKPKDRHGNPAPVDGVPVWSVSDDSLLTVTPSEDGLRATVQAVGPVGTGQVVVKADADLGEGFKEIIGTADVDIVAGEATELAIDLDSEA